MDFDVDMAAVIQDLTTIFPQCIVIFNLGETRRGQSLAETSLDSISLNRLDNGFQKIVGRSMVQLRNKDDLFLIKIIFCSE